jgi:hypothetical protein
MFWDYFIVELKGTGGSNYHPNLVEFRSIDHVVSDYKMSQVDGVERTEV